MSEPTITDILNERIDAVSRLPTGLCLTLSNGIILYVTEWASRTAFIPMGTTGGIPGANRLGARP